MAKEKAFLVCWPHPLLKQPEYLVAKNGDWCCQVVQGSLRLRIKTVVGVRYPELVTYNGPQWKFGKYVQQESLLPGGFLPIFWDVPRANIHAVEDIGAVVDWLLERCDFKSNLAVLHNRNDMTNLFRASNWVRSPLWLKLWLKPLAQAVSAQGSGS